MKIALAAIFLLLTGTSLHAQHQELNEKPATWNSPSANRIDSTSILHAFKSGQVNGSFRYFFMATDNAPGLSDYFANAAGGGLRFETAQFHGFQFALSGYYIFNIGSSDLTKADEVTGQYNRYEIGLFDLENPGNKKDINRLEELYLKYNFQNSQLLLGKQLLNTPFINLQDGRMRPSEVEGAYFKFNELNNIQLEGGWLYSISPRSTTKWYSTASSIGIYPQGVNPDGTKSQYHGNLTSDGIFMLGIHISSVKNLKIQAWNVYIENILNSALLQADFQLPVKKTNAFFTSIQVIRQDAVQDGGNKNITLTYVQKGSHANTFGFKAGWKNKNLDLSLNYNRITAAGRYLMPREWGRDPFFTFLPRERNEGLGDVHAIMVKAGYHFNAQVKTSIAAGYYQLPDVRNFKLNKYGIPSYNQFNADFKYSFKGILKGLEAQALASWKLNIGETYGNDRYKFNKVDMVNYNLVLNYLF